VFVEQVAFVNVPASKQHYDSMYVGSTTEKELTLSRSHIYSSTYYTECQAQTSDSRFNNSLEWFDLMTRYLAILKTVRAHLSNETISQLNLLNVETNRQVLLLLLILSRSYC